MDPGLPRLPHPGPPHRTNHKPEEPAPTTHGNPGKVRVPDWGECGGEVPLRPPVRTTRAAAAPAQSPGTCDKGESSAGGVREIACSRSGPGHGPPPPRVEAQRGETQPFPRPLDRSTRRTARGAPGAGPSLRFPAGAHPTHASRGLGRHNEFLGTRPAAPQTPTWGTLARDRVYEDRD